MTIKENTMTLTEFLLARITEDAADAKQAADRFADWPEPVRVTAWDWSVSYRPKGRPRGVPSNSSIVRGAPSPARVLAECEAKRRLVEWAEVYLVDADAEGPVRLLAQAARQVLQRLALPYADHPDFDPTWSVI